MEQGQQITRPAAARPLWCVLRPVAADIRVCAAARAQRSRFCPAPSRISSFAPPRHFLTGVLPFCACDRVRVSCARFVSASCTGTPARIMRVSAFSRLQKFFRVYAYPSAQLQALHALTMSNRGAIPALCPRFHCGFFLTFER